LAAGVQLKNAKKSSGGFHVKRGRGGYSWKSPFERFFTPGRNRGVGEGRKGAESSKNERAEVLWGRPKAQKAVEQMVAYNTKDDPHGNKLAEDNCGIARQR